MDQESKGTSALDHVLIFGPGYWGRGRTFEEAKKQCPYTPNKRDGYFVLQCTAGTYVNGDGAMCWPGTDPEPVEIERHLPKRKA